MEDALKKRLLQRKFSSIEYMEELRACHLRALEDMRHALRWFYDHPPAEDWHRWHRSEWPETWEERVVGNFERTQRAIEEGIANARRGQTSTIESVCGSLVGLGKNMEGLGWKWWDYVPDEYRQEFIKHRRAAMDRASNIWRTVGHYWKTPESILKENVTGPIDERDLLRYLKPGESA